MTASSTDYIDERFKLCYVDQSQSFLSVWFADCEPELVWGDDWNDYPYEHNAGDPSYRTDREPVEFRTLVLHSHAFETPAALDVIASVEDINNKDMPWLSVYETGATRTAELFAGTSMTEFAEAVRANAHGWTQMYAPID